MRSSDSISAPQRDLNEIDAVRRSHIRRLRIGLLLIGIVYLWSAGLGYYHLMPWRDGTMFVAPPKGELGRLIALSYFIIVFAVIAGVGNLVLAAIADKKATLAIVVAIGSFAVYTTLRLYQTNGRFLSVWNWWVSALVLCIGLHAVYKANQLRKPAVARLVS